MADKIAEKRFASREKRTARIVDVITPRFRQPRRVTRAKLTLSPREAVRAIASYNQRFMARLCQIPEDYKVERVRVQ